MRRLLVCILTVFVVLGASSSGRAAPLSAPSATTHTVGLTPGLCDFDSIEDAIAAANPGDTIRVEDTLFHEAPLEIDMALTLKGGYASNAPTRCLKSASSGYTTIYRTGVTIERILEVESATVSVSGFVFRNNLTGGGVSVSEGGTLDLEDSILEDNVADFGAGLYVFNATANLTGCTIQDNRANKGGGGMVVWGSDQPASATLRNVAFRHNIAANNGGGLFMKENATVTTNDYLQFQSNQADSRGGAIYVRDNSLLTINANPVDKVYIMDNEADYHGAGLYVSDGTVVLNGALDSGSGVEQIFIGSNTADADGDSSGNGGGIYASLGATIQISATAIIDSSAEYGAGVYLSDSTFTGDDLLINYNVADAYGGGIAATAGSTVTLTNDSQVSDWNGTQPNMALMGGGIYAVSGSKVTLDASTIGGNEASLHGGGVYLGLAATFTATHGSSIERNYTFVGGIAGGGIHATDPGTQVVIDASQVATNTAITRGGGLYIGNGAQATLRNGTMVWGNSALDFVDGGAGVYLSGPDATLTIEWSELNSNHSATDGGGILNDRGTVYLTRASLEENYAQEKGGGIFNSGGTIEGSEAAFYKNEAHNGNGGGLYSEGAGSEVTLEGTWFLANEAPAANGGGLATYGTELSVHRNFFIANESDLEGSALYVTGAATPNEPKARIVNSFVVDNDTTAASITGPPGTGSSLYVEGTEATVIHNTFARQAQESFGVYVANNSTVTLTNNIISNFVVGIRRPAGSTGSATASHTLYHSNFNNYDTGIVSTDHMTNGNPAFHSPGNYHLTAGSDAINAGTDASVLIDFDGESRPWDGGYDIGADEFPDRSFFFLPIVIK